MLDPNHPEWKGFVASMRDEPLNDAPRSAFADWLMERGGEAFGTLIDAMVRAARIEPDNKLSLFAWDSKAKIGSPQWEPFALAERAIKSAWGAWVPLKDMHMDARYSWRFHRGFPETVVIDWEGLKYLDWLCAMGPVGEVVVVGGTPVQIRVQPASLHFALDDPRYHPRLAVPHFTTPRDSVPDDSRGSWANILAVATTHFLQELWGDKVTRIRYERRAINVWPAGRT